MQRSPTEYPPVGRAYLTLSLLVLAYICAGLDRLILPLMVGPVRATLQISDFQVSLLQGFAFALFFAIGGVPFGWISDRVRRTWVIAGGMLFWSAMTIACGLSNSFMALFLARLGLGIGEAALVPAGFSMLADSFDRKRLVRATAFFASGGLFSSAAAYFVGGYVIDYLSATPRPLQIGSLEPWQMAFIVVSAPGLLLVPFFFFLPEPSRKGDHAPEPGLKSTVAYLWSRRRDYAPFYFTTMLLGIPNYGGLTWFPTHMIRAFGMRASEAGMTLGLIQLGGSVVGTVLGAALTEHFTKIGRRDAHLRTILIISAIVLIGIVAAPLASTKTVALSFWAVTVIGISGYFGSSMAALQLMTPSSMRASNTSLLMLVVVLFGLAIGTALVGAIADIAFPGQPGGIGLSLALTGALAAIVSIIVSWRGLPRFASIMRMEEAAIAAA